MDSLAVAALDRPGLAGPAEGIPLPLLGLVGVVALAMLFVTRRPEMPGLTAAPLLGFFALRYPAPDPSRFVLPGLAALLVAAATLAAARRGLFARPARAREQVKLWRFLARPAAMAFPVLLFAWSRAGTLILLAAVTAVFLGLDLARLSATRFNLLLFRRASSTFKSRERDRLSSMTLFLVAMLVVTLVFSREVALYAIAFMVFGDFAAKFFGLWFGRTRLWPASLLPRDAKTVEGSLGHLTACLGAGAVIAEFLPVPLPALGLAAVVATGTEALPGPVDDNLTVGVFAAAALHLLFRVFG